MPSPERKKGFAQTRKEILSQSGKQYWRSIEEFAGSPEFEDKIKGEFPVDIENWDPSLSRRNFMKVMGASLALAGLSGCVIQPPEKIVPFVTPPDEMIPGKPLFFATGMTLGGVATGLLGESFDGRPIKIEGNPEHPGSLGATDVFAQGSLLDLYDPDRSQETLYRGSPTTWQDFVTAMRTNVGEAAANGGAGVRFLTPTVSSPTLQDQFRRLLQAMPNARWYQYEPVNKDNAMMGARMALGSPVNTVYRFENALRVLSLDADIFSGFNVRYMKDYATAKQPREGQTDMCRLYTIETSMSLMGAKSDHRLGVKPSQMPEIAKAVAAALGVGGVTSTYVDSDGWIATMARDLAAYRGRSLVVVGDNQPAIVHAIGHAINSALGNVGQTVVYTDPISPYERTHIEQLRELIAEIDAGRVTTLVMLGGNPVYDTPSDLKLDRARLDKVPLRVHLSQLVDETSEYCHWHISEKHYLESWSDARAYDGTVTLVQPLVRPLYDSKNIHEVVQVFLPENFEKGDYEIVKEYWQTQNISPAAARTATAAPAASPSPALASPSATPGPEAQATPAATPSPAVSPSPASSPAATASPAAPAGGSPRTFEDIWRKAVHDGFIPNTALPARTLSASTGFLAQQQPPMTVAGSLEITILPHPTIHDGRFANNGWLQELPDPITKITWDNVALISPVTAQRLGINQTNDPRERSGGIRPAAFINSKGNNMYADLVTLTYQGATIDKPVPMWIQPGQPDDVITIYMGYGRTRAGRIGTGLGYDAFKVMRAESMYSGFGDIAKLGTQGTIASTQIHFNMEGRDLLRVLDYDVFLADPNVGKQKDEYEATMYHTDTGTELYQQWYATHHRWAMSIDLNACVGCNACVIACQAENNIPVVGKEQVERSREMHWLRVDTYYTGEIANKPETVAFQPLPCMQCEQAPCEVVCPVTATVHNPEGLNDMVYNRCVGTRYCSNNCPYKVRRFNFLLYQDWDTPQYKLLRNPEVTIRSRGVMEKCTYCTQRISTARIEAEKDGRRVRDGEVVTACQAVCPTNAIVFGDANDPLSKIAKAKEDPRDYTLLNELNTQPRTTFLASLRNGNKEMPGYKALEPPKTYKEKTKGGEKNAGGEAH